MRSQTLELETASAMAPSNLAISSIFIVADILPMTPAPTTPSEKSISPVVIVVVDTVPSVHAPTLPIREAIPAINNVDTPPKTQAPFTPIREVIPGIHDVGAVSTTLTPFTPAVELISPIDVFGTVPTAREPERHVSEEVVDTAEITKVDSVSNEPLVRPVTYDSQSPQAPEPSVHEDQVQHNEHPQIQTQKENTDFHQSSETATGTVTNVPLQENDIATGHHDEAPVTHSDNHVADMDVEMVEDDGELDYLAKYLGKDEDASAAAAVACQVTEDDQMEMQAAFDEYFAALDAGKVLPSTEDIDPCVAAALAVTVNDADRMDVEVIVEQCPAALQDPSALPAIKQTSQHNIDTDMMVDAPNQAVQEHGPRAFATTEKAVLHDLDTVMTDDIVHGTPEKHNPPNTSTTERILLRHFELDDIMHDATEDHYAAAPSTTAQEIDMMDDVVHQAAERHDTEMQDAPRKGHEVSAPVQLDTHMRDSPEKKHNVSARDGLDIEMRDSPEKRRGVSPRGIVPNPVVNCWRSAVPSRLMARQSGQSHLAGQRRVNSPIVQPIFVSYNAPVPASGSQNSQIHPASEVSNNNPPVQPHLVRNNAPAPVSALLNSQVRSTAQVSVSSTPAQPLRARSNALVSASPYPNGPNPQRNLVTRAPSIPTQQRASHNSGRTSNFPISHVGPPLQQARPSAQQGPSRTPAARVEHEEEPVDPWADQKVKVHKNKERGRKKAEDDAKALANIIARYSLPPPPQSQGTKRKLYIDHYGPDAFRERMDGTNGNGGE